MSWQGLGRVSALASCVAAAAALAGSQAFVIHDAVAVHHGHLPVAAQWAMAIGFEAAIVAVGLCVAVTGFDWTLVVAEVFLLAPSVAIAADGIDPTATPAALDTLAMSVMPLQYAVVILAAHRLAGHYVAMATVTTAVTGHEADTAEEVAVAAGHDRGASEAEKDTTGHDRRLRPATRTVTRPRPDMTDGRRVAAQRYAAMAGQLGDNVTAVAEETGKARRTVRRWRADAERLSLLR
ncbi:MAG: hypothetical protein H6648_05540 [Caldilineae bacterium]|nr:hypothetical protein [Caldilineae bacterium]